MRYDKNKTHKKRKTMKIKDVVRMFSNIPNQEADVNFQINSVNAENDAFDVSDCIMEIMQADVEENEIYDVLVVPPFKSTEENFDLKISELIKENEEINIKLNTTSRHGNIVITDSKNNVLREIDVNREWFLTQQEAIIRVLQSIF